ncbi:hypothetical protein GQ457_08G004250 [Hibiscus cannabinus]
MGKPTGKKRIQEAAQKVLEANKQNKSGGSGGGGGGGGDNRTSKCVDDDTAIFINMAHELKEEGNRLFQRRDHDGAMSKYEKALNLLPKNHIDVAYLRSNMAACYMQLGIGEYSRAIEECNLALEVSPKYSKALLKRARCYEALNKLDLAYADVYNVLTIEPNNLSALDIMESVRKAMDEKGITVNDNEFESAGRWATRLRNVVKEKLKKKNKGKQVECNENSDVKVEEEKKDEEKVIVEEKKVSVERVNDKEVVLKTIEVERKPAVAAKKKPITKLVKLVLGDDIRLAKIPVNCNVKSVRDIAMDKFPGLKGVLVKYRDSEGDLVTITNNDELRLAESSNNVAGATLRFYIVETNPEREPVYEGIGNEVVVNGEEKLGDVVVVDNGNGGCGVGATKGICVEDWIVQFARLFKNYIGFDSDSYLDLHEIGMKLFAEAMEETVTSEDAQEIFEMAAGNFQEMAALALFNWGNVHMSRARRHVFTEDGSKSAETTSGYEWTRKEYALAAKRYKEALNIKPDFYEAFLALGQQQFEQAKHCWYNASGSKLDLGAGTSQEVLQLYNEAEDNMEKGMQLWEEMKEKRLNGLSKFEKYKSHLQKMGLDGAFQDVQSEEATEQDTNMISQIYLLWGTLLYERSVVERKLELPTWEECLEVSIEKFELAGASPTDIAVLIKSHCSTTSQGVGFKIDEIVQAWNDMYDVKRWQIGVPSFRLEPLFRRRNPNQV